jgi:Ca2+-binding EF-hand superfamily protein
MDLTFNVLESIRRDIRELRDDLHIEKQSRRKDVEELQTEVKGLQRDVRLLRQDLVAEREARETGMEALRREMSEELRREVGQVHADIDAQRKRIRVQEEEGFITIDGTCISWGSDDLQPGGAPAATDIDFPRKYRTPPMVFSAPRDHCSFVIGTGDNGSTRVRKDGFTASGLSFAGAEATRKGCMMSWMAIGPRVMDADRVQEAEGTYDARMPRLDQMSAEEQEKMYRNLFRQADTNGNGTLDQREFRQLLQAVNLNLSRSAIRRIMEQADVNNDGSIEYREFVPVMMDIIATHTELGDAAQASQEEQMRAYEQATEYVLEGMTRSQLESAALRIFQAADDDNSGMLDRKEFTKCLKAMNLGFTTKEIQALMGEIDINRDGFVSYDEFLPVAVDHLIQTHADKLLESSSTAKMEEHFMAIFSAADTTGTGKLAAPDLRSLLSNAGMSAVQVEVCMGDAQIGGDGCIVYSKFARICAQYGGAYFGGKPPPPKDMSKLSNDELSTFLEALFASADKDNSGALDEREFRALLQESGLNLTRKAILRIMEAADANDDGLIQYPEFCNMMSEMNLTNTMTTEARERMQASEDQCQLAAEELMGQQPEEQLQKHIRAMFMSADVDNSGYLSRNEFIACMQDADLGLTKKEIVAIMSELDANDDGKIEYGEFVPLAKSIVLDFIKMKLMEGSAKQSVLMEFFITKFAEADARDTGKLSCDAARSVLADCGMSAFLVENLIATANVDRSGNVSYKRFARVCAEVANSDVNKPQPKSSLSNEGRRARAVALFRRVDLDNSGRIEPSEMESYIKR